MKHLKELYCQLLKQNYGGLVPRTQQMREKYQVEQID
jgi:hypothetical protein